MAIEDTYSSLMSDRRKVRKKAERNALITDVGTTAAKLYADNLKSHALDFFKRSEVTNQRVNYKANKELFKNKIQKTYEEGSNAVGGLGSYLVDGVGTKLAKKRIYANMDEKGVMNPDDLGSAVTSYSEEMVYGKKGEDGTVSEENRKAGMLYRLEEAYKAGKNLGSMDAYDDYVDRRADLPETVGAGLMNRFVRGKDRAEIEKDALDRVVNQNQFAKDSEAFSVLAKSFDAGISVKDSEQLAKKVKKITDQIAMKSTITVSREWTETSTLGDNGVELKWGYWTIKSVDSLTGEVTTTTEKDTVNKQNAAMYNRERIEITSQGEMQTITDPRTGQPIKVPTTKVTVFNGTAEVKIVDERDLFNASSAFNRALTVDDVPIDSFIRGAEQTVANILAMKSGGGGGKLRTSSKKYFERFYGEDADKKKVLKDFHINVSNQAGNLMTQYGVDRELALKLSATMKLQNIEYMEKNDDRTEDYKGANLASTSVVNGLRVFEALNYLNMTDDSLVFDSPTQLKELISSLLTPENLTAFTGQGVNRKGMKFDSDSRTYYIKNMSKSAAVNNLYNTKVAGTEMTVTELILARRNTPQIFNVDGTLKAERDINKVLNLKQFDQIKGGRSLTELDNTETTSTVNPSFLQGAGEFLKGGAKEILDSSLGVVARADRTLNALLDDTTSSVKQAFTQTGGGGKPEVKPEVIQTRSSSLLNNPAYGRKLSQEEINEIMNKPERSKEEKDRLMAMAQREISSGEG